MGSWFKVTSLEMGGAVPPPTSNSTLFGPEGSSGAPKVIGGPSDVVLDLTNAFPGENAGGLFGVDLFSVLVL
jgi:hypothetical protein